MTAPRVLVLDDEPVCREVATRVFASLGAHIETDPDAGADVVVTGFSQRRSGLDAFVLGPVTNPRTPNLDLPLDRATAGLLIGRTPPPFDAQAVSALAGGVADAELAMVRDYFDFCGPQLQRLEQAVGARDVEATHAAAHRLTGSVGMIGARRASDLLREIAGHTRDGHLDGVDALHAQAQDEIIRLERSLRRFVEVRERPQRVVLHGCGPRLSQTFERRLAGLGLELAQGSAWSVAGGPALALVVLGTHTDPVRAVSEFRATNADVPILFAHAEGQSAPPGAGVIAGADGVFDPEAPTHALCQVFDRWCAPNVDRRRLRLLYGADAADAVVAVWRAAAPEHVRALWEAAEPAAITRAAHRLLRATLAIGAGRAAALARSLTTNPEAELTDPLRTRLAARGRTVTDTLDA